MRIKSYHLDFFFTKKKPTRNSEALKRNEVRLITRKPTPNGMGIYIVGMQSPWIKLSQAGNRFGIWLLIEADWRVMTPTTYGDSSRINPMIDFLSNVPIFFAKLLPKKMPAFLILSMITNTRLVTYPKALRQLSYSTV